MRDELEEILQPKLLFYPISFLFGENKIKLYALKKEEKYSWLTALREALNYASLSDFYDIKV